VSRGEEKFVKKELVEISWSSKKRDSKKEEQKKMKRYIDIARNTLMIKICFIQITILSISFIIEGYELGFTAGYYKPNLSDLQVSTMGAIGNENITIKNMLRPDILTANISASTTFSGVYRWLPRSLNPGNPVQNLGHRTTQREPG
jgi:hypothetical protein